MSDVLILDDVTEKRSELEENYTQIPRDMKVHPIEALIFLQAITLHHSWQQKTIEYKSERIYAALASLHLWGWKEGTTWNMPIVFYIHGQIFI
ncbi:hypothetical protein AVEN_146072-1 [Araneus ventricosus]|uniref:Uncharacterized protein n=1 Tax=Araneus ventricosus TaxID=182803 RepID=A0A4Y2VR04_ARAVE|nr:hypothetical protein AVEN_146072-1 [Araneus ventricosus]